MVYVCADDYGMTAEECGRIDECAAHGALNKISIFPNTGLADIKERIPGRDVTLGVHLDLVEGRAVSAPGDVWLLADKDGYFRHSFTGLFLLSVSPWRKKFEKQVYCEIKNQLRRWMCDIAPGEKIEIDAHQHTHMIPGIFGTLMRVIRDEGINVSYIRFPAEPVTPYLRAVSLYFTYKPINILKCAVLKLFGLLNRRELERSGIKTALFMGVMFSGKMDEKRVSRVLPYYYRIAEKKDMDIELLFHPGYIENSEVLNSAEKRKFDRFYFSDGRKTEFEAVKNLKV